jgi:hypothetical protein
MSKKELIVNFSNELLPGIIQLIEQARQNAAVYLNSETTLLYWSIGLFINENLKTNNRSEYGAKILATVSQQLILQYGKGYSYSALTRMCKVANIIDETNIATLSQQLSWSHLIELSTISDEHPQVTPQDTPQVTPQVTPQDTPQVTPQVEQLIVALEEDLSRDNLQAKLELKDREHFRKSYLIAALQLGLIEMTIPDKPSSRLQKYRLTEKGKDLQKLLKK